MNKVKDFMEKVREELAKTPSKTIALFLLTILLGMFAAAIVNAISVSTILLQTYISWACGGTLVVVCGIYLVIPFWKFRWRYQFLSDQEENLARLLFIFNNNAKKIRSSIDGIIAIQLFKIEKHTTDESINFSFEKVISEVSKGSEISRIKNNKFIFPIDIYLWLEDLKLPIPLKLDRLVASYLSAHFVKLYQHTNDSKYMTLVNHINWTGKVSDKIKVTGIQYSTIFNTSRLVSIEELNESKDQECRDIMNTVVYNGKKDKKHGNRVYHTVRFNLPDHLDDPYDYAILIIANKKILNEHTVYECIKKILCKGVEQYAKRLI